MSIYYVKPNDDFLFLLANFLLKNYTSSLDKVKVILPYSQQCQELKKIIMLTARKEAMLLPDVLTLKQFITSFIAASNYSLSICCQLSSYEQEAALSKIIQQHNQQPIRLGDALKLSGKLLQLFQQLESQQINLTQLKDFVDQIDSSEYWQNTYKFLSFAYIEWSKLYSNSSCDSKSDIFSQLQDLLKSNLSSNIVILAGLLPTSKLELVIFKGVLSCKLGHVILPPIYLEELCYSVKNSSDTLYDFQYFVKSCNISLDDITYLAKAIALPTKNKPIQLSEFLGLPKLNLVSDADATKFNSNIPIDIEYVKVNSQYDEAKLVAAMIHNYLIKANTQHNKILVVTTTPSFTTLLTMHLSKYQINYANLTNVDIKQLLEINFILVLADLVSSNFSISKFINLIKTSLLTSSSSNKFENLILKNKFQQSELKQILLDLTISKDDSELQKWATFILSALDDLWIYYNSNTILCDQLIIGLLQAAENLTEGKIWQFQFSKRISDVLKEVIHIAKQFGNIDIRDFSNVLTELVTMIKFNYEHDYNANVVITGADSAILLSADYIIIPEFNNDHWPGNSIQNPWLNQAIYSKLGLIERNAHYDRKQYILYTILQKAHVSLINSQFTASGKTTDSQFILKLQLLAFKNPLIRIRVNDLKLQHNQNYTSVDNKSTTFQISPGILLSSADIVKTISATDIEMLIRNPHGFYAKNILRLKPVILNDDQLTQAKFGDFIHKVIHRYTICYKDMEESKLINYFIDIGKQLIDCYNCSSFAKMIWLTKLHQLAEEFVRFDMERKNEGFKIFSEQSGQISLNINNNALNIIAIADRIEYSQNGECYIIDFKTGTVPNKKEVQQGIATQLIIESIILYRGGFKNLPAMMPNKIIYIKITSTKPLLEFTEITVDQEMLDKHELGLVELLQYYIKDGGVFFPSPVDKLAPKYNNYKHLARYLI